LGYSCAIDILGDGTVGAGYDAAVEIVDQEGEKTLAKVAEW
jgi:hypothetical protein